MKIEDEINKVIREVPDFPKEGINFKDITPLLMDSDITNKIVNSFIKSFDNFIIDAIVGIESRGFLYGILLANKMNIPFIPIRKSGKLPGDTISQSYDLEYGKSEIEIHRSDIKENWNVLIHDDLLATGGTASAAAELLLKLNANIVGFGFIVNLHFLDGKNKLEKYSDKIITLIDY
ncbi:MAG: adenine phosphoribosyltransferase [Flavobacteriales bacterium]|nr:adenine phosphoribosyltransferase [Flavobacteriales bacterium]